jgi:hypothetical protein
MLDGKVDEKEAIFLDPRRRRVRLGVFFGMGALVVLCLVVLVRGGGGGGGPPRRTTPEVRPAGIVTVPRAKARGCLGIVLGSRSAATAVRALDSWLHTGFDNVLFCFDVAIVHRSSARGAEAVAAELDEIERAVAEGYSGRVSARFTIIDASEDKPQEYVRTVVCLFIRSFIDLIVVFPLALIGGQVEEGFIKKKTKTKTKKSLQSLRIFFFFFFFFFFFTPLIILPCLPVVVLAHLQKQNLHQSFFKIPPPPPHPLK